MSTPALTSPSSTICRRCSASSARRSGSSEGYGVGAATAPTIERAWWKALAEAFTVRSAGAKLALLAGEGQAGDQVESFNDHILHYADHGRGSATAFLDASAERTAPSEAAGLQAASMAERIAALCERVAAAGSSAYAVDVTSPDVAELGLKVIRVIAPELCALDASHNARFLGGRRLYEAAAGLGLCRDVLGEDQLNPGPAPVPMSVQAEV